MFVDVSGTNAEQSEKKQSVLELKKNLSGLLSPSIFQQGLDLI